MADTKISAMTAASALTGAEVLPVVQSAANVKATTQQVVDAAMTTGLTRQALGSINTNTTIDWSLGSYVTATIAGALTFTFSNPASSGKACVAYLQLTNGGSAVITWPGSVTWSGGTAPTLRASGVDLLRFYTQDGGTAWFGTSENDEVVTGLTNFTQAESTSSPNATVYVDSLTANGSATNVDAAFVPKGTGAVLAQVPDGTATGGNKRGANAVDWQTYRTAATYVASGARAGVLSGGRNTASGTEAVVAGGDFNRATGGNTFVGGGNDNQASGNYAGVVCGITNTASGSNSSIGGGTYNTASGTNSFVPGGSRGTTRGLVGVCAYAAGMRAATGDRQHIGGIYSAVTTGATATSLTADAGAVGAENVMVLPNNSSLTGLLIVSARDTSGNTASWLILVNIKRGANAASTTVVYQTTIASDTAALSGATAAAAADTTQGALVASVAGLAATTIDWCAEMFNVQIVR